MSSKSQSTGSTDHNQPTPTAHKSGMTRRDLLRRSAVGAATVGAVSTGAIRLDHGPVQNSQAIAPAVVAAGVGGSMAVGWALRDYDPLGFDDAPDGLSSEALQNEIYTRANERASSNKSTFIDNKNIIESGITFTAFSDAKILSIDGLNDQKTQDQIQEDGISEINQHETTILKNLQRSWNETVDQFHSFVQSAREHPDMSTEDIGKSGLVYDFEEGTVTASGSFTGYEIATQTFELPDGSEIDDREIRVENDDFDYYYFSLHDTGATDSGKDLDALTYGFRAYVDDVEGDRSVYYLDHDEWSSLITEVQNAFDQVRDDFTMWLDTAYSEVQSGEIDTESLLSPREHAELTAEDEDFPQAIADLRSLNVGVDLEREAEIYLPEVEATLYGQLAYSGDRTLEVGSVDPDATDEDGDPLYPGSIYFNYDISQGEGVWSAHETGVDGGTVTFTSEPFEQTVYSLTTTAGETVSFTTGDFEEDESNEEWTVDLSDQLDDAITQVESIEYYADTNGTQYETIQLQETFEIIDFTDSDGNSYDETNFERSEPQTDDNYITEEEWQEQQERHEELIQQYEDAQASGISIPGVEDVLDGEANSLIGIAVVGMVLVSAILSALNPLS